MSDPVFKSSHHEMRMKALQSGSPFSAVADRGLAELRQAAAEAAAAVKRQDASPKQARAGMRERAAELKVRLAAEAEQYSSAPVFYRDLLQNAARGAAERRRISGSTTDAKLDRLCGLVERQLVEQQLSTRAAEFASAAADRNLKAATPSVRSLVQMLEHATYADDPAAAEYARRGLSALRGQTGDAATLERIDAALTVPGLVHPDVVERQAHQLASMPDPARSAFVARALDAADASAISAAFVVARSSPRIEPWAADLLTAVNRWPDAALAWLNANEAAVRSAEAEAARPVAEWALAEADLVAALPDVAPDPVEPQSRMGHDHTADPRAEPRAALV